MKALIQPKFMFVIILTVVLFSCKNNQDGYNDEIETTQSNGDTADTTNVHGNNQNSNNADGSNTNNNGAQGSPNGGGTGNTGTGSGPGESPKDGATYSGADAQNDSISSVNKTSKNKSGSK